MHPPRVSAAATSAGVLLLQEMTVRFEQTFAVRLRQAPEAVQLWLCEAGGLSGRVLAKLQLPLPPRYCAPYTVLHGRRRPSPRSGTVHCSTLQYTAGAGPAPASALALYTVQCTV